MVKRIPQDTACFQYLNANPIGARTGDCIMRAASVAAGISWDDAIDLLCAIAHERKLAPQDPKAEALLFRELGFMRQKQPKKANGRKLTGVEFCRLLSGQLAGGERVVAHIGTHHVVAVLPDEQGNYRIVDTWDCSSRCIGSWWVRP